MAAEGAADAPRRQPRDATTFAPPRRPSDVERKRVRKWLLRLVLVIGLFALLLGTVASNLIRLGPSTVPMPSEAVRLATTWYRVPDGDPVKDYYGFLIKVTNLVDTANVYPYAIEVNLSVVGGTDLGGWYPQSGDHLAMQTLTLAYGDPRSTVVVNLPAGYVEVHDGGSYVLWTVVGKRGLESQPIFTTSADFYLDSFFVPENATLDAHAHVVVDWYLVNAFQSYSVATRQASATCSYMPTPGSEGTAPYAPCS